MTIDLRICPDLPTAASVHGLDKDHARRRGQIYAAGELNSALQAKQR